MAKIKLTLTEGEPIVNGKQITFKAPCNCEGITAITIGNEEFALVNAAGTNLSTIGNAFIKDAMVTVILDTDGRKAYVQNPAADRPLDTRPTQGSVNLVTSGGVKAYVDDAIAALPPELNTTYTLTKSGSTIKLSGSDGTETTVTDSNTTYGDATTEQAGLMSARDKIKVDWLSDELDIVHHNTMQLGKSENARVVIDAASKIIDISADYGVSISSKSNNICLSIPDDRSVYINDKEVATTDINVFKGPIYVNSRDKTPAIHLENNDYDATIKANINQSTQSSVYVLPQEQGTLMATSQWIEGYTASATLNTSGLYEFKINNGYLHNVTLIVNWERQSTAVSPVFHYEDQDVRETRILACLYVDETGKVYLRVINDIGNFTDNHTRFSYRLLGQA